MIFSENIHRSQTVCPEASAQAVFILILAGSSGGGDGGP